MKLLGEFERFELMAQPKYGHDCYMNIVEPEEGYMIVPYGEVIRKGDKPFDVFAGWIESDGYHAKMEHHAISRGRWAAWERKVQPTSDTGDSVDTKESSSQPEQNSFDGQDTSKQ